MSILIISNIADAHAQAVMAEIAKKGGQVDLLDLAEFPSSLRLIMEFDAGHHRLILRREGGGELDLSEVTAVWWRRPQPFSIPSTVTDAKSRQFAYSEATTAFQGLYQSLKAHWINVPSLDAVAAHKPYQLKVAQEVGLPIPTTLMTNDPDAAKGFWCDFPGEVIHKQFLALPDTWRETRKLTPADEELVDSISITPVIFQIHVPAVADLRVVAVGELLFAGATDVSASDYPQDVRMNLDAKYQAHALPSQVADRLHALMKRLGLVYGAIDLRLTPEGEYVFLEVNPAGQFLYIEKDTGHPIAKAIAENLMAEH